MSLWFCVTNWSSMLAHAQSGSQNTGDAVLRTNFKEMEEVWVPDDVKGSRSSRRAVLISLRFIIFLLLAQTTLLVLPTWPTVAFPVGHLRSMTPVELCWLWWLTLHRHDIFGAASPLRAHHLFSLECPSEPLAIIIEDTVCGDLAWLGLS